jgi:hypothetical protein
MWKKSIFKNLPCSARISVSTQSKPAPADPYTLTLSGSKEISSLSILPISPPVFQKGRIMATKLPHRFSSRAFRKAGRSRSSAEGRTIVKCVSSFLYRSACQRGGSPRWRTEGLEDIMCIVSSSPVCEFLQSFTSQIARLESSVREGTRKQTRTYKAGNTSYISGLRFPRCAMQRAEM